jgi:hypothetical protein
MISIFEHLTNETDNVEQYLEDILDELWDDLNPKKDNGEYRNHSLLSRVDKFRDTVSSDEHKNKFGSETSIRHAGFADYISKKDKLKKIITSKPTDFKQIKNDVYTFLSPDDLYVTEGDTFKSTDFGKYLLKTVFNYTAYRSSKHCYKRYQKLNFKGVSCPYCNENPVKIVDNKNRKEGDSRLLFDLDHFYPKAGYPYLALSFYNHIPSCKICNQTYKGSKDFSINTHIHPFHRCFDSSYQFKLNSSVLRNGKVNKVILKKLTGVIDELSSDLQLEQRYQSNIDLARLPKLVDILSKNYHLLKTESVGTKEHDLLLGLLDAYGLQRDKSKIIETIYGKLQRDVVQMFDIKKTIM